MRLYIAGPMTGIKQFNFPAFADAAAALRAAGHEIISPHELDSPEVQAAAMASPDGKLIDGKVAGQTWGQILARDVHVVADEVEGIVFLPNWDKSRGARLEAFVGILCSKRFFTYPGLHEVSPTWVKVHL
jgi:hypothetical protein